MTNYLTDAVARTNAPLMGDFAPGDIGNNPNFYSLADDPSFMAIGLKASEGVSYATTLGGWLNRLAPIAKACWRDCQYAKTKFRLFYHYLIAAQAGMDGRAYGRRQADFYNSVIEAIGDWQAGDLWPCFDYESGDQPQNVSNQSIIDTGWGFSERMIELQGRMVLRYSGSWIRDRKIVDSMGATLLWVAEYGAAGQPAHLDPVVYTAQGYTLADLPWWQYKGDTDPGLAPAGYPSTAPVGPGGSRVSADISAAVINGGGQGFDAIVKWFADHIHAKSVTLPALVAPLPAFHHPYR